MRLALLLLLFPCLATASVFQRLHAEEATATSFLQSNWNKYQENYHPNYVLDDDPKTAWVEGVEGDGVGESLTIPLSTLTSVRSLFLVIFNGYQKSAALLTANAAPQKLTVTVHGPGGVKSAQQQLTLERKMGSQSFDIPVKAGVADVVLKIDSVHAGSKYHDTCISDVQVFVDTDEPYNAGVQRGSHEALLLWKKARLETAKYYASLPRTYPYVSPHFAEKSSTVEFTSTVESQLKQGSPMGDLSDTDRALYKQLEGFIQAPPQKGHWYGLTARKDAPVPPENFPFSGLVEPLFHLGQETLVEAQGPGKVDPPLPEFSAEEDFTRTEARSNLLVLEGSAKDVRKVYFHYVSNTLAQWMTTETTHVLALLEGGWPTRVVILSRTEDSVGSSSVHLSVTVPTYTEGKLTRMECRDFSDSHWLGGPLDDPEGYDPASPPHKVRSEETTTTYTAQTHL